MKRTKEYRLIIKVLAGVLVCALSLLPCMTTALADSVMNAGRAYGVYNSPNQSQTATSSTNSSGWSPKFGDFYDAFNEIKNLVTGGKQESGNNKPVGVDPTVSNAVESVTGRVGSGVNRMTGAVDNFDRLTDGNSRFDSETADLIIDRVPAAVNFSSSVTGESSSGLVGGYVQDVTDRISPNAVNNYTRNAGWTKTTDSWLRSAGSFGITDETNEYPEAVKIYNRDGRDAYQKYINDKIKNDPDYLDAKQKGDAARGYSSKDAVNAYYRRTYNSNTKGLEGGPNEKPNIYLYPESQTDVRVTLLDSNQITVSIPEYRTDGWMVTAYPDGRITNVDGMEYRYLFYESNIQGYSFQYENAFYLPAGEREKTFERILALYGLNETEIEDFKEYWCSRLSEGRDYYMYPQINEACDLVSPLEISPAPDAVFRLWFVYKEADAKNPDIEEPAAESFIRNGFTVVEWRGMV
ncbi:MAG: hypothetical protein IJM37_00340, partial [Lachnospiraceae bacterium]|nr:hypothetical protein [Lachnospiraceae bacterium]